MQTMIREPRFACVLSNLAPVLQIKYAVSLLMLVSSIEESMHFKKTEAGTDMLTYQHALSIQRTYVSY